MSMGFNKETFKKSVIYNVKMYSARRSMKRLRSRRSRRLPMLLRI